MNLRKAILVSLALSAQLTMFGQAVNLNVRNVSVKKAMTILKQQSGYSFVYVSSDLNLNKKINVNATNLSQAIEQIISAQNLNYEIKGKNIILSHKNASSQKTTKAIPASPTTKTHVRGQILDTSGEPIIGATIKEKGKPNGCVTDLDGNFSLGCNC